jgi:hypothetical protein
MDFELRNARVAFQPGRADATSFSVAVIPSGLLAGLLSIRSEGLAGVEVSGLEPLTSCLQSRRSTN